MTLGYITHKFYARAKKIIQAKEKNGLDIPIPNESKSFLDNLRTSFEQTKKILNEEKAKLSISSDNKIKDDLIKLKDFLEGNGKNYSSEMIYSFIVSCDILGMKHDDFKKIVEELYSASNFEKNILNIDVDFDSVVSLYKEYIDSDEKASFYQMLKKYEVEVVKNIDLDKTRAVLEFLKEKNILEKFRNTSLLRITILASVENVKKTYEKLIKKDREILDVYFEDASAQFWIVDKIENENHKARRFGMHHSPNENDDDKVEDIFSQANLNLNLEGFWENCALLDRNRFLFSENYELNDFGAHLKTKCSGPLNRVMTSFLEILSGEKKYFRRNMGICNLFELGEVFKLPVSLFQCGDIEKKVHLAIELGLLNPPMTSEYNRMEIDIAKSQRFQELIGKQGIYNQSIRNYFARYLSSLVQTSDNEFGMLFYKKLKADNLIDFYNMFFSSKKPGQSNFNNDKIFDVFDRTILQDSLRFQELIDSVFAVNIYSQFISGYDECNQVIEDYENNSDNDDFEKHHYYDEDIFKEQLIKELESNNCVEDEIIVSGQITKTKNDYVYMFGDTIISRKKVLHNATILKQKYGYLDENMLLASMVRNSYISYDTLKIIKSTIEQYKNKGRRIK